MPVDGPRSLTPVTKLRDDDLDDGSCRHCSRISILTKEVHDDDSPIIASVAVLLVSPTAVVGARH